jgi:hypothetical protein
MGTLHTTPRGGLDHPVFAGAGPHDQLLVALAFEPPLTEAELAAVQAELDRWSAAVPRAEAGEPAHCDEPFLGERTLRIRVHNLVDPRAALRELVAALGAIAPLRELHASRWVVLPERDAPAAVLDPAAPEERIHFPSHDDYLRSVFDLSHLPAASEYESQGNGAFQTRTGDIVLEERGVPLHLPPLRIGYGTAKASFAPADARTAAVRDALAASLARAFGDLAAARTPRFSDHAGAVGQLDRLQLGARAGYGFALQSPELVQRLSVQRYRYREPELFEALAEVIRERELAPIVTWQRFGKPFGKEWRSVELHVFQLWEPGPPPR